MITSFLRHQVYPYVEYAYETVHAAFYGVFHLRQTFGLGDRFAGYGSLYGLVGKAYQAFHPFRILAKAKMSYKPNTWSNPM